MSELCWQSPGCRAGRVNRLLEGHLTRPGGCGQIIAEGGGQGSRGLLWRPPARSRRRLSAFRRMRPEPRGASYRARALYIPPGRGRYVNWHPGRPGNYAAKSTRREITGEAGKRKQALPGGSDGGRRQRRPCSPQEPGVAAGTAGDQAALAGALLADRDGVRGAGGGGRAGRGWPGARSPPRSSSPTSGATQAGRRHRAGSCCASWCAPPGSCTGSASTSTRR